MTATARRTSVAPLQAWWWRHPESPAVAIVLSSWVALAVAHWAQHDQPVSGWTFSLGGWTLMCVAMMLAGSVAMLRRISFVSVWPRRLRSPAVFSLSYIGAWVAAGAVAATAIRGVERLGGTSFSPGARSVTAMLVIAAAWQLTPAKRRALHACHLNRPLATRGWAADRSLLAYGFFHARACGLSCWAVMGTMFVAAHDFHLMAPLALITIVERWQRQPKPGAGAAAIGVLAALSLFA